jgi:hypothetical protein
MELLTESLITSLFIIGLYNATGYELDKWGKPIEKHILWWFRYYVEKYIGETLGKPLILCPQCMASFWGVIIYFSAFHHGYNDVLGCLLFIPIVSALNWFIYNLIER